MASEATPFSPWVTGLWITTLLVGVAFSQEHLPTRDELMEMRRSEISARRASLEHHRLMKAAKTSAAQQDNYDVSHYRIEIDIDTTEKSITGTVTMTARARTDTFATVELDLDSGMTVDSVGGDAIVYSHTGNLLRIDLAKSVPSGDPFVVQVAYHGQPVSDGFGGFRFDQHNGKPIIWTLSEPYFARDWWPCKDTPGDKADSVDMIVTVPADLTAASNGSLLSTIDNGDGTTRTFHWHEGYPITTYLVSLAISNYASWSEWFHYQPGDSMEVRYYVYPEAVETAQAQLTETLDMLAYFHDIFGPYPFLSEKYGIAQFAWGGGMEHQTITSQGSFGTILTVHELAHQWWGDKITNASWHEIWLNEGFASYAEALYFEHTQGQDYYHTYMGWMDRDYPYPIYVDDTTSVARIFHITVYDKGGWFLHMLRHIVGDSTFFDILLAYSDDPRFAYGNTTTAGFQSVCDSVSEQDLDWFFQPWIYEVGRPEYRVEWSAGDSAGTPVLNLLIEQTQVPERALFPMPIDITVETALGDTVVTVFNNSASQVFRIPLAAAPVGIIVDQDGWILKRIVSVSNTDERETIPTEFALDQNYPNPFNAVSHIRYRVPLPLSVTLVIYDLLGRKVTTLVDKPLRPGRYTTSWRGRDQDGMPLASGIYLYQIEMRDLDDGGLNFTQTRKMVFLK
ncbi:MAG: T9SS type A sorting domain-containing protein [Calditrichaeota bacterium]|nr:T9SS type A sorting domain-containing protein [Calditrichota bacterium]